MSADMIDGIWTVVDNFGGRWIPEVEVGSAEAALELCENDPMVGHWVS